LIDVVGFSPEHLESLTNLKACYKGEVNSRVWGEAVTVIDGKKVLAIFGSVTIFPGIQHIWALVSEDVKDYPIQFFRTAQKVLAWQQKRKPARRYQIDIRAGYPELQKWAKLLGFECEGLMKKFGQNGDDYYLYARTS